MKATAIVNGKIVSYRLTKGLATAHRHNHGESMSDAEAVAFVEAKRRKHAERLIEAYVEDRR